MKKKEMVGFYFTIYYHLNQGLTPSQIATKYKLSKQRISYYIKGLKQEGLIERVGYGVWKTTSKQVKNHYIDGSNIFYFQKKVRGHGFQFKLILPRNLKNWERRIEYLNKNNISFRLVGNKGTIPRIIYKNYKVWLCDNSIIVYYPKDMSFFSETAKSSRKEAIHNFYAIIKQIERILRADFKVRGEYLFEIPKRHYSLIKNELAGYYLKENKKIEIRDRKGELWALIDNSLNLEELEQVHTITAEKDTDSVVEPFMNLLRENPKVIQEIIMNITANTQIIRALQLEIKELTKLYRR